VRTHIHIHTPLAANSGVAPARLSTLIVLLCNTRRSVRCCCCCCFRYYLSVALYPLVAAWGLYSLLYYPHKSWWSWLINTVRNAYS
jgi:hypothetical protein